jgi:hypothetical protein
LRITSQMVLFPQQPPTTAVHGVRPGVTITRDFALISHQWVNVPIPIRCNAGLKVRQCGGFLPD